MHGAKKITKIHIAPQLKVATHSGLFEMKDIEKTLLLIKTYMDLVAKG